MGFGELDQKAINTIRLLAVRAFVAELPTPPHLFTPPSTAPKLAIKQQDEWRLLMSHDELTSAVL